jgi:hypothetical protein
MESWYSVLLRLHNLSGYSIAMLKLEDIQSDTRSLKSWQILYQMELINRSCNILSCILYQWIFRKKYRTQLKWISGISSGVSRIYRNIVTEMFRFSFIFWQTAYENNLNLWGKWKGSATYGSIARTGITVQVLELQSVRYMRSENFKGGIMVLWTVTMSTL